MDNGMANLCFDMVISRIEDLLSKNTRVTVAIDGMCGSGKSYLAGLIAKTLDCNVFHIDDYYLPVEMRTTERLAQPGGHIYYERFKEEVLDSIRNNRPVLYRPYLCGVWEYGEPKTYEPKKLNIIEGSYSMHPSLRDAYSLTVFLEADPEEQLRRIAKRSGEENLAHFINRWIPLENKYFSELGIKGLCDIVLDTTNLF